MVIEALNKLGYAVMTELGGGDIEIRLPKEQFDRLGDTIPYRYQPDHYVYPKKQMRLFTYNGVITINEM